MAKLLYIQASPRGQRSKSITVADAFVQEYRRLHPEDEIEVLNLFHADLPSFDGLTVQAKYTIMHGKEHSEEELRAWSRVVEIIEHFKSADKYVLAVPMWNFGISYRLKQYIDILVQPTYTFNYSLKEGYVGLVTGKPMLAVYARGGEYREGTDGAKLDMQRTYLELIFGFIGFKNVGAIIVEPTLEKGPEVAEERRVDAISKAREAAKRF
jgi:FMN-dependent NADH-azoreductase